MVFDHHNLSATRMVAPVVNSSGCCRDVTRRSEQTRQQPPPEVGVDRLRYASNQLVNKKYRKVRCESASRVAMARWLEPVASFWTTAKSTLCLLFRQAIARCGVRALKRTNVRHNPSHRIENPPLPMAGSKPGDNKFRNPHREQTQLGWCLRHYRATP